MDSHTHTITKLIKQAEHFIDRREWDEAAARCYQILALDPENLNAQNKLTLIYLQRELVEDMRRAVARLFEPEDAGPRQRRRMLAFSYRVLSCWKGWLNNDFEQTPPVDDLEEVACLLNHAYLHGEDGDLLRVWHIYAAACSKHPKARYMIQWWMAKQYAKHGFFADAAEMLTEMQRACPEDADARYVLAEMRWWRDHADRLPWIP